MSNILWCHSGGVNNTNPNLDLGGTISMFEIALNPLNNLFDDISPEEGESGLVDYRCFYIYNNNSNMFLLSPIITLVSQGSNGSDITIGTLTSNEIQRITISGTPDDDGYIILQTEFGSAFTANYNSSFANLATSIEESLQSLPFCSTCTATLTVPTPPENPYIDIEFNGQAGQRKTKLIQLIANRFVSTSDGHFLPSIYTNSSLFNRTGTSIIKIDSQLPINIDSYAASGPIYVYQISTGLYVELEYSSINNVTNEFNLTAPLTFDLGIPLPDDENVFICYDEVYVPVLEKSTSVSIKKIVQGSPINTITKVIGNPTTIPSEITFGLSPINLNGSLFAKEGMFVWVKRETVAGAIATQSDYFNLSLTGTLVSS